MCVQVTLDRVVPFWESNIAPEIKAGKRVIIAAHGKSLLMNMVAKMCCSLNLCCHEVTNNRPWQFILMMHALHCTVGNSLRALVKYLDNIPEDVIAGLNIPTGVPLVYNLDSNLKPIAHPDAIAPLSVQASCCVAAYIYIKM